MRKNRPALSSLEDIILERLQRKTMTIIELTDEIGLAVRIMTARMIRDGKLISTRDNELQVVH